MMNYDDGMAGFAVMDGDGGGGGGGVDDLSYQVTPHQCNICRKCFSSFKGLQQHLVIHTDMRPFKCDICSQSFRFKSNLFEHQSVHTGFTPYKCSYCDKTCRLKGNLKKHLRTHVTNKEELEAAWRPFAKQDPSRRKSAPYSRRQPLAHIQSDNSIPNDFASVSSYATPRIAHHPRRKANPSFGNAEDWIRHIKMGEILPQISVEEKLERLQQTIYGDTQLRFSDLLEISKGIAFETHNCPVCTMPFMSRVDCDNHCQMEHHGMRTDRFCQQCFRHFGDDTSSTQHQKYHRKIAEMVNQGAIPMEPVDIIIPTEDELQRLVGELIASQPPPPIQFDGDDHLPVGTLEDILNNFTNNYHLQ